VAILVCTFAAANGILQMDQRLKHMHLTDTDTEKRWNSWFSSAQKV
jgi:hypothetical protein